MKIFYIFIFSIILFGSSLKAQVINISNCFELQNLKVNNNTVVYNITQDLFCSSLSFATIGDNSSFFQGRIEGNSYSINDLSISSSSPYIGLFEFGKDCIVKNLILKNLTIDTTNKRAGGALFANCTNCKKKKKLFLFSFLLFINFFHLKKMRDASSNNHSIQPF